MHPWVAVWIFSLSMSRAWQGGLVAIDEPHNDAPDVEQTNGIAVRASTYLKSAIIDQPLPELILDRLSELHWMEREPALGI